jgi:Zn-dependent M28 family amino/carboxypeptidase
MKRTLFSSVVFLFTACGTLRDPAGKITAEGILADVLAISADSMGGRAPGTEGEARATAYIASRYEAIGLEPFGDSFLQPVALTGLRKDRDRSSLTIRGPRGALPYRDNETLTYWSTSEETVDLADVPIVFVGYGVEAPEYEWDDLKGENLSGKVLLFLNSDPPVEYAGNPAFGGEARTYYGRWTYKYEQAMKHQAAGAIVVHTTESAGYPFRQISNMSARELFAEYYQLDFLAWIDSTTSEQVAQSMGTTLTGLFDLAATRDFRPRNTGHRLTTHIETNVRRVNSHNVVGVLSGSDPDLRDEIVVFSAHYDHLGTHPSVAGDDKIFNGAWDNASGTASIINVAEAFAAASPKRSILFLACAAEEAGLLGSRAFVVNPPVELNRIVANYNVDAPQIFGLTSYIASICVFTNTLGDVFLDVGAERGLRVTGDPDPNAGLFYRSDQLSFAKAGIPALYLQPGSEYDPPLRFDLAEYKLQHHHQVSDEVNTFWDLRGAERDLRILFEAALRVANATEMPRWKPGNEFEQEWKALYRREP